MRVKPLVFAGLMVFGLAACDEKAVCTPELAQTKVADMMTKLQELAMSDPARLEAVGKKVSELQPKFAGLKDKPDEACAAIDEIMELMK